MYTSHDIHIRTYVLIDHCSLVYLIVVPQQISGKAYLKQNKTECKLKFHKNVLSINESLTIGLELLGIFSFIYFLVKLKIF